MNTFPDPGPGNSTDHPVQITGDVSAVHALETELGELQQRLHDAKRKAANEAEQRAQQERAALEQKLTTLQKSTEEDRKARFALSERLAAQRKQEAEQVERLMQSKQASWEIERDFELERVASHSLLKEELRGKRELMESMIARRVAELDEIEAQRTRWGRTKTEQLEQLLRTGELLASEYKKGSAPEQVRLAKHFFEDAAREAAGGGEVASGGEKIRLILVADSLDQIANSLIHRKRHVAEGEFIVWGNASCLTRLASCGFEEKGRQGRGKNCTGSGRHAVWRRQR